MIGRSRRLARKVLGRPKSTVPRAQSALRNLTSELNEESHSEKSNEWTTTFKYLLYMIIIVIGTIFLVCWQQLITDIVTKVFKAKIDSVKGNLIFTAIVTIAFVTAIYVYVRYGDGTTPDYW